jgi:hypothetical protein
MGANLQFKFRSSWRQPAVRYLCDYTPKHGSWLNMAESELGVLASQCLDRRIADKQILTHEVSAWQDHRNKHHAKPVVWWNTNCQATYMLSASRRRYSSVSTC